MRCFPAGRIVDLAEQRILRRKLLKHRTALGPAVEVHRLRAIEQVLHIVGCK